MELSEQFTSCSTAERNLQIQIWENSKSCFRISFCIFLVLWISSARNKWLVNRVTLLPNVYGVCEGSVQPEESILSPGNLLKHHNSERIIWRKHCLPTPASSSSKAVRVHILKMILTSSLVGFFCCYMSKWALFISEEITSWNLFTGLFLRFSHKWYHAGLGICHFSAVHTHSGSNSYHLNVMANNALTVTKKNHNLKYCYVLCL